MMIEMDFNGCEWIKKQRIMMDVNKWLILIDFIKGKRWFHDNVFCDWMIFVVELLFGDWMDWKVYEVDGLMIDFNFWLWLNGIVDFMIFFSILRLNEICKFFIYLLDNFIMIDVWLMIDSFD